MIKYNRQVTVCAVQYFYDKRYIKEEAHISFTESFKKTTEQIKFCLFALGIFLK